MPRCNKEKERVLREFLDIDEILCCWNTKSEYAAGFLVSKRGHHAEIVVDSFNKVLRRLDTGGYISLHESGSPEWKKIRKYLAQIGNKNISEVTYFV